MIAPPEHRCPAARTLTIIGGRWKIPIIFFLLTGTRRFSELARALNPITQKMLSQELKELEAAGVVRRKIYAQIPLRVEYSLTSTGRTLRPVIAAMCRWGNGRGCRISQNNKQRSLK